MIDSRRTAVQNVTVRPTTHAGLWLDKYMAHQLVRDSQINRESNTPHHTLLTQVSNIHPSPLYRHFFQRWEAALAAREAVTYLARVEGRMIVGMGSESVLETAVSLHRTYGVPFIPGSALKGLEASYACKRLDPEQWGLASTAYQTVFGRPPERVLPEVQPDGIAKAGTTEEAWDGGAAGYITFFDALPHQDMAASSLLQLDILTVHHQEYYQGKDAAPADWDSPNPVSFLSASGTYLLALAGPPDWVAATFDILRLALAEFGVGAKTSSGYGRLALDRGPSPVVNISTASVATGAIQSSSALASLGTTALSQASTTGQMEGRGVIKYHKGRPYIQMEGESRRLFINWQELKMIALGSGTPIRFLYESLPDGQKRVISIHMHR